MPDSPPCKVCFQSLSSCICPECPQCGETGNPNCYKNHVLKINCHQAVLRTEIRIAKMEADIDLERNFLQDLNEKPESYCEEWSEV